MTQWGLDTIFNPAKRHMDEEKRRLQSTRSEIGDSSGGKRIDLESGKVVIAKAETDEESDAGSDATAESAASTSTAKSAKPKSAKPKSAKPESAAQARARARRAKR